MDNAFDMILCCSSQGWTAGSFAYLRSGLYAKVPACVTRPTLTSTRDWTLLIGPVSVAVPSMKLAYTVSTEKEIIIEGSFDGIVIREHLH